MKVTRAAAGIGTAVLALALVGCSSGSGSSDASGSDAGGGVKAGTAVTINGCEPQNPLIPSNTNETCGGNVIDNLFVGLVTYNAGTAAPENAVASSIESSDQKVWTIKLNNDWKFTDGTPVNADSFIKAWNWAAQGKNAQVNSYFFEPIEGFEAVNTDKATEMTGLKKLDDYSFQVTLSSPNSQFPVMVGYTGFAPLPESFYADPKAFGQNPVGNGPFKFVSWDKKKNIQITANPDYQGTTKPKVETVDWKIYQSLDAAYADLLAGNLDVLDAIPSAALAGETYKNDLGDRVVEQATGVMQTISFPMYDKAYESADLRKAISMSIDRPAIIKAAFDGAVDPATGWVSPVVNGYKAGACGEYCTFDPAKAKELLAKSGSDLTSITLAYNSDGDNKSWVDATCVSITNALGIKCTGKAFADFATFLDATSAKKMTGMFRSGWQMDYPSIENFLVPLYKTGAAANDSGWSNAEFDQLVDEAASQPGEEGIGTYQKAEAVLAQEMPVIPTWYGKTIAGYSDQVKDVQFTPFSRVDLLTIATK